MLPNFHTNLKGVMKSLVMAAVCLLFVDTLFGMDTGRKDIPENGKTDRLEDFARIYGAVRWFMPSDEAMAVDWNGFTLHAVSEVLECQNNDADIAEGRDACLEAAIEYHLKSGN